MALRLVVQTHWKSTGAIFLALKAGMVLRNATEHMGVSPNKDFPPYF
ncbi:MAG: hypothetical protein ACFFD2_13810 [Promethearchaeota archaeon]